MIRSRTPLRRVVYRRPKLPAILSRGAGWYQALQAKKDLEFEQIMRKKYHWFYGSRVKLEETIVIKIPKFQVKSPGSED